MKLKNIFIAFITIFTLLFGCAVNAATSAPNSFYVKGSDAYAINGTKYLDGNGTITLNFKKAADGTIVYCTEIRKVTVTSGTKQYTLLKELDARYAYVIQNGYPNKTITGDKDKDYFITAVTVWYLSEPNDSIFTKFDFSKGTYAGKENGVAKEMARLLDGANKAVYAEPSIEINGSSDSFTLSSDKKYYVSSNLGVTTNGNVGDYTVSLTGAPSGTIVTDVNGNEKSTFATSDKFVVKVPVSSIKDLSSEFKISVSANGHIDKAYLYGTDESKYQKVAVLYPVSSDVSNSITAKINIDTEVVISKIDITNGQELPGATLTIKNSNGEVVKTWVSSDKPEVIKGLSLGKYTLTEEIAPDGYELSTETIEFEVSANGVVTKVVMENKPVDKTPIFISKQDIATKKELAGAYLEVRDENGNLVEAWVSTDTPHMIEKLEAGKYFLTEILAPEGYELSTETVEFIVNEDGTVNGDIIMYNEVQTVEVPNTSSFKNITTSLIGIIVIAFGAVMIYKNYKKNEEY